MAFLGGVGGLALDGKGTWGMFRGTGGNILFFDLDAGYLDLFTSWEFIKTYNLGFITNLCYPSRTVKQHSQISLKNRNGVTSTISPVRWQNLGLHHLEPPFQNKTNPLRVLQIRLRHILIVSMWHVVWPNVQDKQEMVYWPEDILKVKEKKNRSLHFPIRDQPPITSC